MEIDVRYKADGFCPVLIFKVDADWDVCSDLEMQISSNCSLVSVVQQRGINSEVFTAL